MLYGIIPNPSRAILQARTNNRINMPYHDCGLPNSNIYIFFLLQFKGNPNRYAVCHTKQMRTHYLSPILSCRSSHITYTSILLIEVFKFYTHYTLLYTFSTLKSLSYSLEARYSSECLLYHFNLQVFGCWLAFESIITI